jgi:hypothetical protein
MAPRIQGGNDGWMAYFRDGLDGPTNSGRQRMEDFWNWISGTDSTGFRVRHPA